MNPTGTCALCRTENVTLIDSHIVSKWIYRRLVVFDPTAGAAPVRVDSGGAVFSSEQATERLLCKPCEDLLGVRESYVAQCALQPDSVTFPALDAAKRICSHGSFVAADVSDLDVAKITHFAVSVVWRADLGQIEPIVSLSADREPLRRYLLGMELPDNVDLVLRLLRPDVLFPRVDRALVFPASSDDGTRHDFVACGMHFALFTSANTPASISEVSLPRAKRALISDGRTLLHTLTEKVQTSVEYGKLNRSLVSYWNLTHIEAGSSGIARSCGKMARVLALNGDGVSPVPAPSNERFAP